MLRLVDHVEVVIEALERRLHAAGADRQGRGEPVFTHKIEVPHRALGEQATVDVVPRDTQVTRLVDAPDHGDFLVHAEVDLPGDLPVVPSILPADNVAFLVEIDGEHVNAGVDDRDLHVGVLVQIGHMFETGLAFGADQVVAGGRVPDHVRARLQDAAPGRHVVGRGFLTAQVEIRVVDMDGARAGVSATDRILDDLIVGHRRMGVHHLGPHAVLVRFDHQRCVPGGFMSAKRSSRVAIVPSPFLPTQTSAVDVIAAALPQGHGVTSPARSANGLPWGGDRHDEHGPVDDALRLRAETHGSGADGNEGDEHAAEDDVDRVARPSRDHRASGERRGDAWHQEVAAQAVGGGRPPTAMTDTPASPAKSRKARRP